MIKPSPYWEQNLTLLRKYYPGLAEGLGTGDLGVVIGEEKNEKRKEKREGIRDQGSGIRGVVSKHSEKQQAMLADNNIPHSSFLIPHWSIQPSATGDPTLCYQDNAESPPILIHSKRDPIREAQRQVESILVTSSQLLVDSKQLSSKKNSMHIQQDKKTDNNTPIPIILLGFGLGYTAEALAKTGQLLIIVERRNEVFRLALEQRNLQALLGTGKAMFIIGEKSEGICGALGLLDNSTLDKTAKPIIIRNRALMSLTEQDKIFYEEVERHITVWASRDEINAATLRRFGKRWTRNLTANLQGVHRFPGVNHLKGIFAQTEIPVFLAAAGPSLNAVRPHLAQIHERCVTVAVDTSLNFLLKQGIEPDFVVSVDPQYWNAMHLHRAIAPNTALIAESAVYPSILKPLLYEKEFSPRSTQSFTEKRENEQLENEQLANSIPHSPQSPVPSPYFLRVFFCQSLFPLGRFIEDRTDPKGALGAGGSVATSAWDFARLLGPNAVWIAGLDLAFPGRQTHFKGALFEENAHAVSNRLLPAETASVRALQNGGPFYASSAAGGQVLTDKRLSLYAAWFQNRIAQARGLANYTLSHNGLAIPGLIPANIETLLALPSHRSEINKTLQDLYRRIDDVFDGEEETRNRKTRYDEALQTLVRGLQELRNSAQEAALVAERALAADKAGKDDSKGGIQDNALAKLDKVNAIIANSPVKDAAGFLFPPTSELEQNLNETNPLRRHLEFSRRLYRSLREAVAFTLHCLDSGDRVLQKTNEE